MSDTFALMRDGQPLLFAWKKGDQWRTGDRATDSGSDGKKVTVIVPGQDVLSLSARLAGRNEREMRRTAMFAIEDELAQSLDETFAAIGSPQDGSELRPVRAVSAERMTAWVERLDQAGLSEARLVCEHDCLPENNILVSTDNSVLGAVDGRAFGLDRGVGADILLGLIDGVDQVQIIGEPLGQKMRMAAMGDGLSSPEDTLIQLSKWADGRDLINLRQDMFAAKRQMEFGQLRRWKLVGGLAAAALAGWFVTLLIQTHAMNGRAEVIDGRIGEFMSAGWPDANGNVAAALADARAGNRGQDLPSALILSSVLYDAIGSVEGSKVRSLRFDADRGEMSAMVSLTGFGDLDRLAEEISQSGVFAEGDDARQSGDLIVGELTMRGRP